MVHSTPFHAPFLLNFMNRNDSIRVLLASTMLSAFMCWLLMFVQPALYGGQPVSMTPLGHGVCFLVGSFLGLYVGAIIGGTYSKLRSMHQNPIRPLSRTEKIVIPLLVSTASGGFLGFLLMSLITFPDDFFRMLYNVEG